MLDRRAVEENRSIAAVPPGGRRRWPLAFVACAGLLGAAGVGVGAAAAHLHGSDLARTGSEFLLIHAAVIVGVSAVAMALQRLSGMFVAALMLFVIGSVLFGGGLALAGLWDLRPVPLAAPTGGLCLIAGWSMLTIASAWHWVGRS